MNPARRAANDALTPQMVRAYVDEHPFASDIEVGEHFGVAVDVAAARRYAAMILPLPKRIIAARRVGKVQAVKDFFDTHQTASDGQCARKTGIHVASVNEYRNELGIPRQAVRVWLMENKTDE